MSRRIFILIILCLIGLAGCYTYPVAGPFVTDIAYDGEGNLVITKNTITCNTFNGEINNSENSQTFVIKTPKK